MAFGGLFNRGRGPQQQSRGQRGNDVEVDVRVSFEDALRGAEVTSPCSSTWPASHVPWHRRRTRHRAGRAVPSVGHRRRCRRRFCLHCSSRARAATGWARSSRRRARPVTAPGASVARSASRCACPPVRRTARGSAPGQGRGGFWRRIGRRPVRRRARRAVEDLQRRGDDLIACRFPCPIPPPHWAARSRFRRRGCGLLKVPAGPKTGSSCGSRSRRDAPQGLRQGGCAPGPDPDRGAEEGVESNAGRSRELGKAGADEDEHPRYMISCSRPAGRHAPADPSHLRAEGARSPQAHGGNTRLYSDSDVERLRLIQRLT